MMRPAWRSIIDRRNRPTKRQTEAGVPTGELPRNRAAQLPGELLLLAEDPGRHGKDLLLP